METKSAQYLFNNAQPMEEIPEEEVVDLAGYRTVRSLTGTGDNAVG